MNNNWQIQKLGEVCDFYNGLWKGKKPPYIEVGVIRNTNFTKDGKLNDADIAYLEVEKKQFENRKLTYGDIILEKSGGGPKQPVGRVVIFNKKEGDFSFSNFTSAIRVKKSSELDFNFLHCFLFFSYISGITEKMQSHSTGIRNLDTKLYKNIQVPIPSIFEQRRIVKILDETFKKIEKAKENAEKNLKNSKELFESYLNNIFVNPENNWEQKTLGELSDVITKGTTPTTLGFKFINKGINFVKIESITTDGEFIPSKFAAITLDCHKSLKRSQLQDGDILYSIAGALGRTAFVTKNILPANTNQAIAIVRLKTNLNVYPEFVLRCLHPSLMLTQISKYRGGVAQQNLSLEQLKSFVINLPPIKDQNRIVKEIDAVFIKTKKLETIYKEKLANLEELKKSILKKAFNGEL